MGRKSSLDKDDNVDLVDKFIGTAYDKVVEVGEHLGEISTVSEVTDEIVEVAANIGAVLDTEANAIAAAASQVAAKASEDAAEISATNAATSETNAANSETNVANSETLVLSATATTQTNRDEAVASANQAALDAATAVQAKDDAASSASSILGAVTSTANDAAAAETSRLAAQENEDASEVARIAAENSAISAAASQTVTTDHESTVVTLAAEVQANTNAVEADRAEVAGNVTTTTNNANASAVSASEAHTSNQSAMSYASLASSSSLSAEAAKTASEGFRDEAEGFRDQAETLRDETQAIRDSPVPDDSHNHSVATLPSNLLVATNVSVGTGMDNQKETFLGRFSGGLGNPFEHTASITYGNGSNVVGQIATHFTSGETKIRAFNSGWSTWRTLWDSSNFNPAEYAKLSNPNFNGVLTVNGQIMNSSASLQVNGFSRMGTIYLHEGNTPDANEHRALENIGGSLKWNGQGVWHAGNLDPASLGNPDIDANYNWAGDHDFSGEFSAKGTIKLNPSVSGKVVLINNNSDNLNIGFDSDDNGSFDSPIALRLIGAGGTNVAQVFGNAVWHAGNFTPSDYVAKISSPVFYDSSVGSTSVSLSGLVTGLYAIVYGASQNDSSTGYTTTMYYDSSVASAFAVGNVGSTNHRLVAQGGNLTGTNYNSSGSTIGTFYIYKIIRLM